MSSKARGLWRFRRPGFSLRGYRRYLWRRGRIQAKQFYRAAGRRRSRVEKIVADIVDRVLGSVVDSEQRDAPFQERFEPLEQRVLLNADFTGTFDFFNTPDHIVPGSEVVAGLNVTNSASADQNAAGLAQIDFYASADGTLDAGDTLLATVDDVNFNLAPGESQLVQFGFEIPLAIAAGNYTLIADIDSTDVVADENNENNNVVVGDSFTVEPEFNNPLFDVDGDGAVEVFTDGLLIIRHMFGFTGSALTSGVLGANASRLDPGEITAFLNQHGSTMLDPDADEATEVFTDGLLIIRNMFGFTGSALTSGVLGANANRVDPAEVSNYMNLFQPGADNGPPVLLPALQNQTEIVGTLTEENLDTIEASLDGENYFDLFTLGAIDGQGNITLTAQMLETINGEPLGNGAHVVTLRAVDLLGNEVVKSIRFLANVTLPSVAAAFSNDTGRRNNDGITQNPAFAGSLTDNGSLILSVDLVVTGEVTGTFDITDQVSGDGTFSFDQSDLEALFGGPLADGNYGLTVRANNESGNSGQRTLNLRLDRQAPGLANIDLSTGSDTGTLGDGITAASIVTLIGQTEPGARVSFGGFNGQATNQGTFQVPNFLLADGANNLTVSITDAAGNTGNGLGLVTRDAAALERDAVLVWNEIALEAIRRDATVPPEASRALAMVSIAVYDAVNAIEGTPAFLVARSAEPGASLEAAVAAAAHAVLIDEYPGLANWLNTEYTTYLAGITDGPAEDDGVDVGASIGEDIVLIRSQDGHLDYIEYSETPGLGVWEPTAPAFELGLLPQWANLQTFGIDSPDQFLPDAPPEIGSPEYIEAFNQVKSLGQDTSTARTAEQTEIARFWLDGLGTYTPPGQWNVIASEVVLDQAFSLTANARLFAMMNVAMADAAISAWNAKYHYDYWRPVTAIQNADTDGSAATVADPDWRSFAINPNFPAYTSGHSTFGAAAAGVLTALVGDDIAFNATSLGMPGVMRSFDNFWDAAEENGISRVYGGVHWSFDNDAGMEAGAEIADFVLARFDVSADTLAPVVVFNQTPAVTDENITITGRVIDNIAGVETFQVSINGGAAVDVPFDADGNFSFTTSFATNGAADGDYAISFTAEDFDGNAAAPRTVELTLDTVAPTIDVESIIDMQVLEQGVRLQGSADATGSNIVQLTYQFDDGMTMPVTFDSEGNFNQRLNINRLAAGDHVLKVSATDAGGNTSEISINTMLDERVPLNVTATAPANGSIEVGTTFRPQVFFSRPIVANTLNADNFYATDPTGEKLDAQIVPAQDGSFAWLFFDEPLAGASTITVHVEGDTILGLDDGAPLDADNDGNPGGELTYSFTTVSLVPIPGTTLRGYVLDPGADLKPMTQDDVLAGPDGSLATLDDEYLTPLAGVHVFILGLEDQGVFTDENGYFEFDAVPTGTIKLAVDGQTATNAPEGFYFPEMVMDLDIVLAEDNTVMGTMGSEAEREANKHRPEMYLPRLASALLRTVSDDEPTMVDVDAESASALTPEQRGMLTLEIQPGSVIGMDGSPMFDSQVGMSTVPPEIVRDMLPPGVLQHSFDITIQAPGAAQFSTPARITFPNVFGAAPGSQLNFLSFDHTTGRLVIEGTATVSADGLTVVTDPDTGITKPGWHGLTPQGTDAEPDNEDDDDPCDDDGMPKSLPPVTISGFDKIFTQAGNGGTFTVSVGGSPDTHVPAKITVDVSGVREFVTGFSSDSYSFTLRPGQSNTFRLQVKETTDAQRTMMMMQELEGLILTGKIDIKATGQVVSPENCDMPDPPLEPEQTLAEEDFYLARAHAAVTDGIVFPGLLDEGEEEDEMPDPEMLQIRQQGPVDLNYMFSGDMRVTFDDQGSLLELTFQAEDDSDDDNRPTGQLAVTSPEMDAMGPVSINAEPPIDLDPLAIRLVDGSIEYEDDEFTAKGKIQIGMAEGEFVPLVTFDGTLVVTDQFITGVGSVDINLSGVLDTLIGAEEDGDTSVTLFAGGFAIERGTAKTMSVDDNESEGEDGFKLGGLSFGLSNIEFASGQLELQGFIQLPDTLGGVKLSIEDDNKVQITSEGISVTGAKLEFPDIDFTLLDVLDVHADNLSLEYVSGAPAPEPGAMETPDKFIIRGNVTLMTDLFNAEAVFAEDDEGNDNRIEIRRSGLGFEVDVVGTLSVSEITVGGFEINELKLEIDTTMDRVAGSGMITIPSGIEISGEIEFINKKLNKIGLDVDNINKPIGATGAFLQLVGGAVDNIADETKPIEFTGKIGASGGPTINVDIPDIIGDDISGGLIDVVITGKLDRNHIEATGVIALVGDAEETVGASSGLAVGSVTAEVNWNRGFAKYDTSLSILDGLITYNTKFMIDSRVNIFASGTATASVPESIPWVGGETIGSASAAFKFTNNGFSGDDFVLAYGSVPFFGTGGIVIYFDGDYDLVGQSSIDSLVGSSLRAANFGVDDAFDTFAIGANNSQLLIGANWDNANSNVAVQIMDPDGNIIHEDDFASHADIEIISDLSDDNNRVVRIANPGDGEWSIEVVDADTLNLGDIRFDAMVPNVAPTLTAMLPEVDTDAAMVAIDYTAADIDSDASVQLFLDNDNADFDGIEIDSAVEMDGNGQFVIDTTAINLEPGQYYLYMVANDGSNVPVMTEYSAGRITITDPDAPGQVTNLLAQWVGDDQVELTWSPVISADFYQVDFTSNAAGDGYNETIVIDATQNSVVLNDSVLDTPLTAGETYRFTVSAMATDIVTAPSGDPAEIRHYGAPAEPSVVTVGADPIDTVGAGEFNVYADPGSVYTGTVVFDSGSGESADLIVGPNGSTFSDVTGEFEWNVPGDADGFSDIVVAVTNAQSEVTYHRFTVLSDEDRTATIVAQKFSDADRDGMRDAGETGVNGVDFELVDAITGNVLSTATSASIDLDGGGIDAETEQGVVVFSGLTIGDYIVREVDDATPGLFSQDAQSREVSIFGGTTTRVEIGNPASGDIRGTVLVDDDFSGSGDTPIEGVTLYLDINENGAFDPSEPTAITDVSGDYEFSMLLADEYVVRLLAPADFAVSSPADQQIELTLTADQEVDNQDFTLIVSPDGMMPQLAALDPVTELGVSLFQNFGTVSTDGPAGDAATLDINLTNVGGSNLTIESVTIIDDDSGSFSVTSVLPGTVIVPESFSPEVTAVPITVTFDPTATGMLTGTLSIVTNQSATPLLIDLAGIGQATTGDLVVEVPNNNAGGLIQGTNSTVQDFMTLRNTGAANLTISNITGGQFNLVGVTLPIVLAPGESQTFDMSFTTQGLGLERGFITIESDDPETPIFDQRVVATGLPAGDYDAVIGDDFVVLETPAINGAPVLNTISDDSGFYTFFIPANAVYNVIVFDPQTDLVGHYTDLSNGSGGKTLIEKPVFQASTAPDSDGDGLPDDIEKAIGTNVNGIDTDGDNIDDFQEIELNLDPLGGLGLPVGVTSNVNLSGPARAVVLEGSTVNTGRLLSFVATGNYGLGIVDVTNITRPITLGEIDLPGDNRSVGVDLGRNIAVVSAGAAGVHLVDVRLPTSPRLLRTLNLPTGNAGAVTVFDGYAYVASNRSIVVIDLLTRKVHSSIDLGGNTLTDVAYDMGRLYTLDTQGSLKVVNATELPLQQEGSLSVASANQRLFVGGGIAYVTSDTFAGGFSTIDVSDPNNPTLIAGPSPSVGIPSNDFAINGSGLAVSVGAPPTGTTLEAVLLGVDDPNITDSFLSGFELPEVPLAVAIGGGFGFVADDNGGLQMINYTNLDANGIAPTVAVTGMPEDIDDQTAGVQILEGTRFPITLDVTDDVQVARVEVLVNGQVVRNDVSFPWDFIVDAPQLAGVDPETMTIIARATDTGGNVADSAPLTFDIVVDSFAPELLSTSPSDNDQTFFVPTIELNFNEAINENAIDATGIVLTNLGDDGQVGGGDDTAFGIDRFDLRQFGRSFSIVPAGVVTPGDYRLTVAASALQDLAGNPLDSGITLDFTVRPASEIIAQFGTPAIQNAPSANPNQEIDFIVPWDPATTRVQFVTSDSSGNESTRIVSPSSTDPATGTASFIVPTDAVTGDVILYGTGTNNLPTLNRWTITQGDVDLNGADRLGNVSTSDPYAGNGLYLQFNANESTTLESKQTFNLTPGDYRLTFELAGDDSGSGETTKTMEVSVGTSLQQQFTRDTQDPFSEQVVNFTVPSATTGKLAFEMLEDLGAFGSGLFLDNVRLENLTTGNVLLVDDFNHTLSDDELPLQIVPTVASLAANVGLQFQNGSITLTGTGFIEGDVTINFGDQTVVDTELFSGPNVFNNNRTLQGVQVPATAPVGPITVTTSGGTSAPIGVLLDSITSTSLSGAPANAGVASANPGQTITIVGSNFDNDTAIVFPTRNTSGDDATVIAGPRTVSEDGTTMTVVVPENATTGDVQLVGDLDNSSVTLQVVPVVTGFDISSVASGLSSIDISIVGAGFTEGDGIYTLGMVDVVDDDPGTAVVNVLGNNSSAFLNDVPFSNDLFGAITVTTAGGVSAPLALSLTDIASVAISGTPANAAEASANAGQFITLEGTGLTESTEFFFVRVDDGGTSQDVIVTPSIVVADGTRALIQVPTTANGAFELRLFGATQSHLLQIVPTINSIEVTGGTQYTDIFGTGFVEGDITVTYGESLADDDTGSSLINVFSNGGTARLDLPRGGYGDSITVTTVGGTSSPLDTNLLAPVLGDVFGVAYNDNLTPGDTSDDTIIAIELSNWHVIDANDGTIISTFANPAGNTNDVGIQVLPAAIPSFNGTAIPAGTLLITDGDESPDRVFAVDISTGAVIETLDLIDNENYVGGFYHPGRDSIFVVEGFPERVREFDPADGSLINEFILDFDVNFGGITLDPGGTDLWIVTSQTDNAYRLTPDGVLVDQVDLGAQGVAGEATGISFGPDGMMYIASNREVIYRIDPEFDAVRAAPSITSISTVSLEGTPANGAVASANVAQVIEISGTGFDHPGLQFLFPTRNHDGDDGFVGVVPTVVNIDGTSAQVLVPTEAISGTIYPVASSGDHLGFSFSNNFFEGIHRNITLEFTAEGTSTPIFFQGTNIGSFTDESWGIDNVSVAPTNNPGSPIFADDFESGADPRWLFDSVDSSEPIFSSFLGRFNNHTQGLALDGLVDGQTYELTFDFYAIDSWNGAEGNDYFSVVAGSQVLMNEAFASVNLGTQTYVEPGSNGADLQVVPRITEVFTAPGTTSEFRLFGSGFVERDITVTVGGVDIVDRFNNTDDGIDVFSGNDDLVGQGERLLDGPITVTTSGGSFTVSGFDYSTQTPSRFDGIEAVANAGTPGLSAQPSANTDQEITLFGSGFSSSTRVQFPARDITGALGVVTITGSASADGTELTLTVPARAVTGDVSIVGADDSYLLQVVPTFSGFGGDASSAGDTLLIEGTGFMPGDVQVRIDGVEVSDEQVLAVFDLGDNQSIMQMTVPAGVTDGRITIITSGGRASFLLPDEPAVEPTVVTVGDVGDTISEALAVTVPVDSTVIIDPTIGDNPLVSPDIDMFAFELTADDVVLFDIDAIGIGSELDAYLRIFDSEGNQLAAQSGGFNSDDPIHEFFVPETGTYYVGVSDQVNTFYNAVTGTSRNEHNGSTTGEYLLGVSRIGAADRIELTPASEPGDTLATSQLISIPLQQVIRVTGLEIGDGPFGVDDVDLFRIDLIAGDEIEINALADALNPPSSVDTILRLFNASGVAIASNDDGGFGSDSIIRHTVTATGTYYIGVSGFSNFGYDPNTGGTPSDSTQSVGEYELSVFRQPFDRTVIRSIEGEAERGTPRLSTIASANPGQQITLRGERFDGADVVTFVGVNASGDAFELNVTPDDILDGGRTLLVTVPSGAVTGSLRINETIVGPMLQVVPVVDNVDQGLNDQYFDGFLNLTGSGMAEGHGTIWFDDLALPDRGAFDNVNAFTTSYSIEIPDLASTPFGPISVSTLGGTSDTVDLQLAGLSATADSGTPADGGIASANPGQVITLTGVGFNDSTDVVFNIVRDFGTTTTQVVYPVRVNEAGTEIDVLVPSEAVTGEVNIVGNTLTDGIMLQIVPYVDGVTLTSAASTGETVDISLSGGGFVEGQSNYTFGGLTVNDLFSSLGPDVQSDNHSVFFNDVLTNAAMFGGITVTTAGGTSAPFEISVDQINATAYSGTPADAGEASANPGQVIEVQGNGFSESSAFLLEYIDDSAVSRVHRLTPSFVNLDGTRLLLELPTLVNGAFNLRLIGASNTPLLQIVPTVHTWDINGGNASVNIFGSGFVEENMSFNFNGSTVTDTSAADSPDPNIFSSGTGANFNLGLVGFGAMTVTTAGGTSDAFDADILSPGFSTLVGVAWDSSDDTIIVADTNNVSKFNPNSATPVSSFALPDGFSDNLGLHYLDNTIANFGGVAVSAGHLLIGDGQASPDRIFAVDPDTGVQTASLALTTPTNLNFVAMVYHPGRGTIFVVNSSEVVNEIDPATGDTVNTFTLPLNISFGGLALDPGGNDLWAIGSLSSDAVRFSPDDGSVLGSLSLGLRDLANEASGLDFDDNGDLLVSSNRGVVYRFDLDVTDREIISPALPTITSISGAAAEGTPADGGVASANTGQAIEILGTGLDHPGLQLRIPVIDDAGVRSFAVLPITAVNDDGTRLQAIIPANAETGDITATVTGSQHVIGNTSFADFIHEQITLTFTADGTTADIEFADGGLQGLNDESWGIDNVSVAPTNNLGNPIFTEDFESGADAAWRQSLVTDGGTVFSRFSGNFSNDTQALSLAGLTPGQDYQLTFDLYILDSWDGSGSNGPDIFGVVIDDQVVMSESFGHAATALQSYQPEGIGSAALQIVPVIRDVTQSIPGTASQFWLNGSGLIEGATTVTIGGKSFVDQTSTLTNNHDVAATNSRLELFARNVIDGPVTVTTAGGSFTLASPLPEEDQYVRFDGFGDFENADGTPVSNGNASINTGQRIRLEGANFDFSTRVMFEAVDDEGVVGTVSVTPTSVFNNSRTLEVIVPAFARTGSVSILGADDSYELNIVPTIRALGGTVANGEELIISGSGFVEGEVSVTVDGQPATNVSVELVVDSSDLSFGNFDQMLLRFTAPASGVSDGVIVVTTNGGSETFAETLSLTSLADVAPASDVGDSYDTALPVTLPADAVVKYISDIGALPDIDVYELTLAAGDLLIADIDAESLATPSALDGFLRLYDSNDNSLTANSEGVGESADPALRYNIETSGTYYLVVSNDSAFGNDPETGVSSSFGSQGNYELSISRVAANATSLDPIVATATSGTPANAAFASVVPGQTITLTGEGFTSSTFVEMLTMSSSGTLSQFNVFPDSVEADGTSMEVTIPSSVVTGMVRINGELSGRFLQVVPLVTDFSVQNSSYFNSSLGLSGSGFSPDHQTILLGGFEIEDRMTTSSSTVSISTTVPAEADFGPYQVRTIGGISDPVGVVVTDVIAVAGSGTPADAGELSANTGQQITIEGMGFESTDRIVFTTIDTNGSEGVTAVTPDSVEQDGSSMTVTVPLAASTGTVGVVSDQNNTQIYLQIVPTITSIDIVGTDVVDFVGTGLIEGNNTIYTLGTNRLFDFSPGNTGFDVDTFNNLAGDLILTQSAPGLFSVTTAGGTSAPIAMDFYALGLDADIRSVAFNAADERLFVALRTEIHELDPDTGRVLNTFDVPGSTIADQLGLYVLPVGMTLNSVALPAGTLLLANGDANPESIYGIDPDTGNVLATLTLFTNFDVVGITYNPITDRLMVLDGSPDEVVAINPADGTEDVAETFVSTLNLDTTGAGIVIDPVDGNYWLATRTTNQLIKLDSSGTQVDSIDLAGRLVDTNELTGIAFDDLGQLLVSSDHGVIYVVPVP